MNRLALALVLVVVLVSSAGCRVTDAAIATEKAVADGNDRYHDLAQQAFDGTIGPDLGLAPVTTAEFLASPRSMQILVHRLLDSLHANRFAAHSVLFQLDEGPDPATLNLQPVQAPPIAPAPEEH